MTRALHEFIAHRQQKRLLELMGHLDDDTVRKLVRGNAIRMLQLPFAP